MRYYVELTHDMVDVSMGRLYLINQHHGLTDNIGDHQSLHGWEDETGYVVEL